MTTRTFLFDSPFLLGFDHTRALIDRAAKAAAESYPHRGIAARGFVRSFVLADGLEIAGAKLEHGLLHVDLIRPETERSVRRIPISVG